ncbi:MAG: shikimate dehydrogenase, partial [Saprospiraceae bacterium]
MRLYALIGYPLTHSFSQRYFTEKFAREHLPDARYVLFPLPEIAGLPRLLAENPQLRGLNVTIPHKETVLPYVHELDDTAREIGAVN